MKRLASRISSSLCDLRVLRVSVVGRSLRQTTENQRTLRWHREFFIIVIAIGAIFYFFTETSSAQTRRNRRPARPQQPAPRGSAAKYSAFLHSSNAHKGVACNSCHKLPTD